MVGKAAPKVATYIKGRLPEVPESAFTSARTPLDEIRTMVQPSKQQVKFQDDVIKGAYFARRHPAPTPEMKQYDFDDLFAERTGAFKSGLESSVLVEGDTALKFSKGN